MILQRVFPAQAGMILTLTNAGIGRMCFPRASRDDPRIEPPRLGNLPFSPRKQG